MAKLISIVEIIADTLIGGVNNQINLGGAPLNACAQVIKLGGNAVYLSKIGAGTYSKALISELDSNNIDKKFIVVDKHHNTTIAYVSINENGERSFSFSRNKACELNLNFKDYAKLVINKDDIVEFGSVALQSRKSRATHDKLIKKAKDAKALVAFDPNLRPILWNNDELLKKTVFKYIKKVDILKLSTDEYDFLYKEEMEENTIKKLFSYGLKMIIISRGKKGATLYLNDSNVYNCYGYSAQVIDTTGCGDSLFGAFLYKLLEASKVESSESVDYLEIIDFACRCGTYTCTNYGAIKAMPTLEELNSCEMEKNI